MHRAPVRTAAQSVPGFRVFGAVRVLQAGHEEMGRPLAAVKEAAVY
ncbi:hypothetical protein [Paenibacillus turpanensis]|nr:hypothetical protein [Paenibacillus turpanensis]